MEICDQESKQERACNQYQSNDGIWFFFPSHQIDAFSSFSYTHSFIVSYDDDDDDDDDIGHNMR